ncbi:O-methyltransferase [Acetohalobium arabaticum]|uniref:tRNA 5-hydroxyuridine methyltransferase n=1 Tax=Acetohalobium arabaticum (strain ATCC 49924 / DSM 5501 / Z-7288) TaxID=574087 RepID=D9QUQ6_ACEAZ|nr:O-methyltransferase [Acetohalobium arabaticum]ADL11965.1 O-methyltransferase family 3 [Acetohalobium arabaticum DSM 5501]
MSKNILTDFVQDYIEEINPEPTGELKRLEEEALGKNIPIITPEIGQFLSLLIDIHRPERILELGTATGYSTAWLAKDNDCEIVTIELKEREAKVARKNFKELGLEDRVELLVGDAVEVMDELEEKFDFIFIDAAKGQYVEFLKQSLKVVKEGGLIVADNILFKGMIANDDLMHPRYDTLTYRIREYIDEVMNHPELKSSILPLGDGLAISMKLGKEE